METDLVGLRIWRDNLKSVFGSAYKELENAITEISELRQAKAEAVKLRKELDAFKEYHRSGYVKNCDFFPGKVDEFMVRESEYGFQVRLDGYAVLPKEDYYKLRKELDSERKQVASLMDKDDVYYVPRICELESRLEEARWIISSAIINVGCEPETISDWWKRKNVFLASFQKQESERENSVMFQMSNDAGFDNYFAIKNPDKEQIIEKLYDAGYRKTEKAKKVGK